MVWIKKKLFYQFNIQKFTYQNNLKRTPNLSTDSQKPFIYSFTSFFFFLQSGKDELINLLTKGKFFFLKKKSIMRMVGSQGNGQNENLK